MNRQINDLRTDISKISQMNDPRPSPKMKRYSNSMKTKHRIVDEQTRNTQTSLETLEPLCALNNRHPDIKGGKNNTSETTTL